MSRHPTLSRGMLLAFALPAVMQGFTHTAGGQVLTGIYAKYLGLSLGAIGSAVLLCKVFDAVTDPIIGALSDAAHRRSGSRKAWVLAGALVTAVSLWFLLSPPQGVGIGYFTAWYLMVYAGWTITEIPYRAWSAELTSDYVGRTRIAVWVFVAALLGAILVFIVPMVAPALGLAPTKELTPRTLAVWALIAVVALPLFTFIAVLRVPDGAAAVERPQERWREFFASILRNKPLLYLNGVFLLHSLAAGMTSGVAFLFFDVYLRLGSEVAALLLMTVPVAIIATPIWGWLCSRYEKHRAWAAAAAIGAVVSALIGLVSPGEHAFVVLAGLLLLNFFFGAAAGVAMPSMLGDIVDYGRLEFGRDRAGVYYSFYTLIQKSVTGAGMAIGLFVAEGLGFDATGAIQTDGGVLGIKAAYGFLPAVIGVFAVPFLLRYPIGRVRHTEILQQLELQAAAETRNATGTPGPARAAT